jgi:hypothetical protein
MERPASHDLFGLKANLGFVVRGDMETLGTFNARLEALISELGLKIAFKTASASKLWIKEGEPDG